LVEEFIPKHGTFGINGAFFFHTIPQLDFCQSYNLLSKNIKFKYENIKIKKRMSSGSCPTSKLYDKIIKNAIKIS
jgi:hypothetical protein